MSTYYTSKYSGEQIDEAVEKILEGGMTGDYADRQLSNLDTPQGALVNLGAGVRPSLLVNGDFRAGHVVNQRGQTSYTENLQYSIDMWKINFGYGGTGCSISVGDDAVSLIGGTQYIDLQQYIESYKALLGKTVCFSVLYGNRTLESLLCNVPSELPSSLSTLATKADKVWIRGGNNQLFVQMRGVAGATTPVIAAKLEEGDTQTLAYQDEDGAWQLLPQPESDYATQLARCQRYLLPIGMGSVLENIRVSRITSSGMYFFVPTPAQMRVAPTLSGDAQIITMSNSTQTGFAFSTQLLCNGINVVAAKDGHGLSDARLNLQNCFLSAEF